MRVLLSLLLLVSVAAAHAQPVALVPEVTVQRLATVAGGTARIVYESTTGALYTLTTNGDVFRWAPPYSAGVLVASTAQHGLPGNVQGLAIGPTGTLYLTGNLFEGATETGVVKRGTPNGSGGYTWATVAQTVAFVRSASGFDHLMNGIVVSPDGAWLTVNQGSRTEHGEVQTNGGAAPGAREMPITSLLLRLQATATGLTLPNDEAALQAGGYLYADGFRNSFDLAYDADGQLYATENSGDRDDNDELNRIVQGGHYGFPWRLGTHDTPQRVPGYNVETDLLVNHAAAGYINGTFHDDPTYPAPPAGVTFRDPVVNVGPDADRYRDAATGEIRDASSRGEAMATFTSHRSPLGLTFDPGALPPPYTRDGFVLSWTDGNAANAGASPLLSPFGDDAQDLLHLDFLSPDTVSATRIVSGFEGPMDAVLVFRTMYVVEIGASSGLWAVQFRDLTATEPEAGLEAAVRVAPNPFQAAARVTVDAARTAAYQIDVTDVLGRRVATLHEGVLPAGRHLFTLDGTRLPAGLYLVRVAGPDGVTTRRVVRG